MILVGKSKGKRPLGSAKHRWNNEIKMDLGRDRMVWYILDCSNLG
jgi:hypothetical protein